MANSFTFQDQTFHTGDTVKLHLSVTESDKTRIQIFEGLIIGIRGRDLGKSITVRKIATASVGVERIVPLHSPLLQKIDLKAQGQVRRAKLYYLRSRIGKQATKVKLKDTTNSKPITKTTSKTKTTSSNKSKTTPSSSAPKSRSTRRTSRQKTTNK